MRGTPGAPYATSGPARSGADAVRSPADVERRHSALRPSLDFEAGVIPRCPDPQYSELPLVLPACLRRIARWRTPPNWSRAEWAREVRAQACLAACLAEAQYDPSRGVPLAAFLHQRVLAGVLTRYRQEWAFASHCSGAAEWLGPVETSTDSSRVVALREMLEFVRVTLPPSDRALLIALYWQDRTEATIARTRGVSQQAVSKQKLAILRELRHNLD